MRKPETAVKNVGRLSGDCLATRRQTSPMVTKATKVKQAPTMIGARRSRYQTCITIKGFNAILDGEVDDLPEQAFLNVGTIEDAKEKAKKLLEAAKG